MDTTPPSTDSSSSAATLSSTSLTESTRFDVAGQVPHAAPSHVVTSPALARMPQAASQPALHPPVPSHASPLPPSLLDGLLTQLIGPALITVGLVRMFYRADWSATLATSEGLGSSELWSHVLLDAGAVGMLVALWVAAWRRAHRVAAVRVSTGWDVAAVLLFVPLLVLSTPALGLVAVGLSGMLTTFAALFGCGAILGGDSTHVAAGSRTANESRWGEAAMASIQVALIAAALLAGGSTAAAATALCAAALVGAMGVLALGPQPEETPAH